MVINSVVENMQVTATTPHIVNSTAVPFPGLSPFGALGKLRLWGSFFHISKTTDMSVIYPANITDISLLENESMCHY